MTPFKFHTNAAAQFDHVSQEVLDVVEEISENILSTNSQFEPDTIPVGIITEDEINGTPIFGSFNAITGETECIVLTPNKLGLRGENCKLLDDLVFKITSVSSLANLVSSDFIRTTIISWIVSKLTTNNLDTLSIYIENQVNGLVSSCTVWILVAGLHIQDEITVGNVVFSPLTSKVFDIWYDEYKAKAIDVDEFRARIETKRRRFKGFVAAVVTLHAEPEYASKVALLQTKKACAYLRLFHPANITPSMNSFCQPMGLELRESYLAFVEAQEQLIEFGRALDIDPRPWKIDSQQSTEIHQIGLGSLNNLLQTESKSPYQEKLLASLLIYSRNNLEKNPVEKLIFIFGALETLLLKNSTEPLQQNIADRLAFILEKSPQKRIEIVDLTKVCYGYRSQLLHHGNEKHQIESITLFMRHTYNFFIRMIQHHERFNSSDELHDFIDRIKYS